MENNAWWYAINNEKKGLASESEQLLLREPVPDTILSKEYLNPSVTDPYYQQEFQKIILSGESYTGKWCRSRGKWIFYHAN